MTPPWFVVRSILGGSPLWRGGRDDTIAAVSGYFTVRIAGRDEAEQIALPEGEPVREELARFLNRQGPYAQMWIRLASGEYVRYDAIVSIAPPPSS
jgi:hypothetical protein